MSITYNKESKTSVTKKITPKSSNILKQKTLIDEWSYIDGEWILTPSNKIENSNFNNKFKDKNGNQYFLKNSDKTNRHVISEELKNTPITKEDNIFLPMVIDTEYTAFIGNPETIKMKTLEKNQNKQLLQITTINSTLINKKFTSLYDLAKGMNLPTYEVGQIEDLRGIKQQPTLNLTTQMKHALYDDPIILLNPKIKNIYEEYIKDETYRYPYYDLKSPCHILDNLKHKGIEASIERKPLMDDKEFSAFARKNYKTCTITTFAYFLLVDQMRIFQGEYLADMIEAVRKGKIKQDKRLISNNHRRIWYPKWLITINGETYRLAIEFADIGAVQGKISFAEMLSNLNMNDGTKNLLDGMKDNMLLAMLKKPEEFKRYAIGDLEVYEANKKHNELFSEIYETLNLKQFDITSKLTTGSTVNDLQEATLLNYIGCADRSKENKKLLKELTYTASPNNLKSYMNVSEKVKKGACLKRHKASKTFGGRCYNNRQQILATSSCYTLCDIDISAAYTSIASILNYFFGSPVMLNFNEYKVTTGQFYKENKKHLIKRGYKFLVETKKDRPLKYEQDVVASCVELKYKHDVVEEDGKTNILTSVKLDNTPTGIYSRELTNASISWDELNLILNEMTACQRDDFLNNTYMISAIYYPADFECHSIEELKEKIREHELKGNGRLKKVMDFATIDNEDGEHCHYWHAANFGKLLMTDIIQYRLKNKKSNPSLAYLFKLVGNTIYGNNVSRHFPTSNIVLAANITGICRVGMWCAEKALNIYQTITDGGVFDLNEVIQLLRNKIDTTQLVRSYQKTNKYFAQYRKWSTKPITSDGKKITYQEDIGWLVEGVIYDYNKSLFKKTKFELDELKALYGETHIQTITKQKEFDIVSKGLNVFFHKINQLVIDHIKKIFPNIDLFNGLFKKCKVDERELAIKDENGEYIYEESIGLFKFEVKNLCNYAAFHGSADYIYNNTEDKITIKMRGYEAKTDVVSWYLNNKDELQHDPYYYKEISPIIRFLSDLKNNPERVSLPRPFTKSSILKTAEYKKNFNKTWRHTNITPGYDYYEMIRIPVFTLRNKFTSYAQHKAWISYYNSLKRRNAGLSFEVFYMNDDGTINYKKMVDEIDKYISDGVMNPKKIFDKDDNFQRNIRKNKHIINYITLVNSVKNLMRISLIGVTQFLYENAKVQQDNIVLMPKKPHYITKEWYAVFESVSKYSEFNEYQDHNSLFEL